MRLWRLITYMNEEKEFSHVIYIFVKNSVVQNVNNLFEYDYFNK